MCTSNPDALMARATESHLEQLCHFLPESESLMTETVKIVTDIFHGVEKYISTPITFMTTLGVAIDEVLNDFSGILGRVVCIPFTSCGIDGERYQTDLMKRLHDTFLPARMSEPATEVTRETLHTYGLDILFLCCCGTVLGKKEEINALRHSEVHYAWDKVRSFYNAERTPIEHIRSLEDLEGVETFDLSASGAERKLFRRIEQILHHLARVPQERPDTASVVEISNFLLTRAQAA